MGRLESLGIEWSMALGHQREDKWEARHALGPAVTWRMSRDWRLHGAMGPAWSSKRSFFERGYQLRSHISYKNIVSLDIIWQTLPAAASYERIGGGSVTSLYGELVFHGEPGAYILLGAAVLAVVYGVVMVFAVVGLASNM